MEDYGNHDAMIFAKVMALLVPILMAAAIFAVFYIICFWKIYSKAGKPGWACIIPVYRWIILFEIIGKPIWWIVLLIIPLVNLVIIIIVWIELAKSFGKSTGFAMGMLFLSFIFFPILAFDDSTYIGPGGVPAQPISPTV